MLKRILVPLDSSKFTSAAIRMAANIANREKTREGTEVTLVGLGIVDTDQLPSGRFSSVVDRDQIIADAEQEADGLIAAFKEEVEKQGIPNEQIETKRLSGPPFKLIIRESVFSDLIVMGEKCSFPHRRYGPTPLRPLFFGGGPGSDHRRRGTRGGRFDCRVQGRG